MKFKKAQKREDAVSMNTAVLISSRIRFKVTYERTRMGKIQLKAMSNMSVNAYHFNGGREVVY